MSLVKELAHNLFAVLVIARKLVREPCHCKKTCPRTLSLRWNVVTEAISLPVDRRTTFAMTSLNLPAVLAHNFSAVLVIARKLVREPCHCKKTCPRTLSLRWNVVTEAISLPVDRRTTFAMTIYTAFAMTSLNLPTVLAREPCHCEPCRKHGVAISLQATLVFGLLRYARNDKKQDGHVVLKDSSP